MYLNILDDRKKAKINSGIKSGKGSFPINYHPASITRTSSKLLKLVEASHVTNYLKSINLPSPQNTDVSNLTLAQNSSLSLHTTYYVLWKTIFIQKSLFSLQSHFMAFHIPSTLKINLPRFIFNTVN